MIQLYKWEGRGHYLGAVVIVSADCLESAKELIEKELIDCGLAKSWQLSEEIQTIPINDCRVVYLDNGDY